MWKKKYIAEIRQYIYQLRKINVKNFKGYKNI